MKKESVEVIGNVTIITREEIEAAPVKITEKEFKVMHYIIDNEYQDVNVDTVKFVGIWETWMWCASEYSGYTGKSFSGICASLIEKELICTDTTGEFHFTIPGGKVEDTYTIALTEKGFNAWKNKYESNKQMSNQKLEKMTTKKEVTEKKAATAKKPVAKKTTAKKEAAPKAAAKPAAKKEKRESNVDLAKRLLKEKATVKQINAAFTKAYASKTSDSNFIAKRAQIYMEIAGAPKAKKAAKPVAKKEAAKPAAKKAVAKKPVAKKK